MTNNVNLSREDIARYATSTGYLRYMEGSLHTAMILRSATGSAQSRWAAALNLQGMIKRYKEEVPEDIRCLINIDLRKLEEQVLEILENPLG